MCRQNILDTRGNYRFLPTELRDLHNQKELFRAIYTDTNYYHLGIDDFYKIGWTQMHVNVMDVFLFNMALREYCLKKDARFQEIGLYEFRTNDSNEEEDHVPPCEISKEEQEMHFIKKARELTDHISALSSAELDIKVKCMNVIIDLLKKQEGA